MTEDDTFRYLKYGKFTANDIKARWIDNDMRIPNLALQIRLNWIDKLYDAYKSEAKDINEYDQYFDLLKKFVKGEITKEEFRSLSSLSLWLSLLSMSSSVLSSLSSSLSPLVLSSLSSSSALPTTWLPRQSWSMSNLQQDADLLNETIGEYEEQKE